MNKKEGPVFTLNMSCRDCIHLTSDYYYIEDGNDVDCGFEYKCNAGYELESMYHAMPSKNCRFLKDNLEKFLLEEKEKC